MKGLWHGPVRLALLCLLVMSLLAVRQLLQGLRGAFTSAAILDSGLFAAAGLVGAWHLASGAVGAAAVRRGAWLSALITLVLVLNCSATGVATTRGMGYQLALAAPSVYLTVLLLLVGPLLVSLIAPALLAHRPRSAKIASFVSGILALVTTEAGLISSYSGFCSLFSGPSGESACVTATTGAVAGFFGLFGVLLVLPFVTEESRRQASGL